MITAATALPLLGLRITAGPVELRGITDDLLGPLAQLAVDGIHDPGFMPFTFPWSLTEAADMPRNVAQYHWGKRAGFSPAAWTADFAVFYDGELVGAQGFSTKDYLVVRGGERLRGQPRLPRRQQEDRVRRQRHGPGEPARQARDPAPHRARTRRARPLLPRACR